ncbi:Transcriptional regulatory protein QseB [Luteitalea pratensis]|uniref:Transcriptional regulatory protein QseB n=1 Tax=Luteitalea pratensis TaxID=1855912 RepID=A0A143PPU6_LUTPR|nr:winged helix-turn-helix domain-containing protein [Luteitalea pratensis]AMY10727.1 Transcriptional regulatory protein QseB [Luteitalea pratensis]
MSLEINEIYGFGSCRLDVGRRLVISAGNPVALPPKTFELLVLLVRHAGRALSKQELMTALWPNTFVEEANLSFQVSTLRKALGVDGAAWIETLPTHGYRFSADVLALAPPVAATPIPSPTPGPSRARVDWRWIGMGASVIVLALAAFVILDRSGRRLAGGTDGETEAVTLTAYEGMESSPSLSPDGSQVAFVWSGATPTQQDIYVKLVGPGEPVRLTTHPARDDSPAWSPDGQSIAFLRWTAGNDTDVDVLLIPALGNGAERRIASTTVRPTSRHISRLAWTPDGKWLAIAAAPSPTQRHGIWLLSPDGREQRRLTKSHGITGYANGDASLAFSTDGRHLAFARSRSAGVDALYVQALSPDMKPVGDAVAVTEESPRASLGKRSWFGVALSPDESTLLYSVVESLNRDLMLVDRTR